MLTTQQITTILRQQLPYLSAQYGIKRLGLFGSYAKGHKYGRSCARLPMAKPLNCTLVLSLLFSESKEAQTWPILPQLL